jgi:hypothetical protein
MGQCVRSQAGERGSLLAQGTEKGRHVRNTVNPLLLEVVLPAKRHGAAPADVAMELELSKGELRDLLQQILLLSHRDQLCLIRKAGGQRRV